MLWPILLWAGTYRPLSVNIHAKILNLAHKIRVSLMMNLQAKS
jgi:hypothetical protein